MKHFYLPKKEDWISSLVVFIVAIPLSLGIALASGGSPASGLITAALGGIVAGALAGAPLVVTGPAAGLTAFVFQIAQQYGLAGLAVITALCGVFQIAFGFAKWGRFFKMIPQSILEGVLSAIGLMIVFGQLHVLMGAPLPKDPVTSVLSLRNSFTNSFNLTDGTISPVLLCGILAIAIQIVWLRVFRKWSWIPAALPAVFVVTLASLSWNIARIEIAPLFPSMEIAVSTFFSFSWLEQVSSYLMIGFGLAFIASSESLLTARAVDTLNSIKTGARGSNLDRELIAQGFGNTISGILGGLPMTAVMARSAVNVNSGAKSRWSTILHGAWIALCVSLVPMILTRIPLSALAAVLILTGIKLINLKHYYHTWIQDKQSGFFWTSTTFAVFFSDLLHGLIFALGIYTCSQYKSILRYLATSLRTKPDPARNY